VISSSSRRRLGIGVTALLMSLTACGSHGASSSAARRAPAFRLPEVRDGARAVSLADFKGKPMLINFFGAWCVPCRAELPLLQQSHAAVGSKVAFVGIDTTDSRSEAVDLLNGTHVTYPAAYDPKGTLKGAYGVRAMPTTFFVRADGTIADQVAGKLTSASLDEGLRSVGVG
jgi:cytochrome c biogenesis protein CcmG/thiol:disulfide interchange protein DsbE